MTVTQIAVACGVAVVVALWCARYAFSFAPPSLSVTYRRLYSQRSTPTPVRAGALVWERWFADVGVQVASSSMGARFEARRRFVLRAAGVTVAALAARVFTVGVVAAVVSLVAMVVPAALGARVPVWLVVVAPLAVGVLAGWYQLSSVLTVCTRRYRAFRAGVAAYIQLVSVCMTTRRSMTEAVTYAADVGVGPGFETISAAVHAAPQMGVRVWEALDAVGAEYDCRELQDLAASVGHVARIGVGVEATVTAVATRMRQVALDDMQRTADRQTSTMFGPTILFVLGVVAFLAYPLAVRVLAAFAST
jgi:hypothetical protein